MRRKILDQNRDVLDAAAELFRKRIQGLFCNLNKILALHHSPLAQALHLPRVASIVLLIAVTFIASTVSFSFLSSSSSSDSLRRRTSARAPHYHLPLLPTSTE